uniref:Potassium channel tetramerization domain-containing protein n=1 Tax=Solanum tuberosum TaxID=4113 RepID=M1DLL1_SOLTU
MGTPKGRVKLNVGGRIFETTATTLEFAGQNSLFRAMLDENWNLHSDSAITEHFIDRDPDYFAVLLNLLRTGELYIPPKIDKKLVYKEAEYYGILDHVRSAECDKFDGNRPLLARSITGWSVRDAECDTFDGNRLRLAKSITGLLVGDGKFTPAIQAGPNAWCCVSQGSVAHVYDWMLEEHPTINLDYRKVNDVCWVDSENIVVSSDEKIANGGMGLFRASTGELRYKFQVTDEMNDYTTGILSCSSDYKLFSSCKSTSNGHVIGVWDQVTGKQIDFLSYYTYGNARRLQWLHGTNCLMATSFHPRDGNCCISLLDFRKNITVISWSDVRDRVKKPYITDQTKFRDVIAIEESYSICVVDKNERLGFIDLRKYY